MNQHEAPQDNPYRSPEAEVLASDEPIHFGLSEPICLEGTKTVEHMLQATEVLRGKRSGCVSNLTVLAALVIVWLLFLTTAPRIWSLSGFMLAGSFTLFMFAMTATALAAFFFYHKYYGSRRRLARKFGRILGAGRRERICFSETGLEIDSGHIAAENQWPRFSSFRETADLLLLQLRDYPDCLVVPREYCASDAQWHTIGELLLCKLPRWEAGNEPIPPQQSAATASLVEEETPAASEEGKLVAAGRLTPVDVRRAQRTVAPIFVLGSVIMPALLIFTGLILWTYWGVIDLFAIGLISIGTGVLIARLGITRWQHWRIWRAARGPYEPQQWVIHSEGLHLTTTLSRQEIQWPAFVRAHHYSGLVLLQIKNKSVHILPQRYFASAQDWNEFVDLVNQKVGR